jgi:molybdopterin-binding protein
MTARSEREVWVTPLDVRLLSELARTQNLVRACRVLGIGRDRGVYRLRRLSRASGVPLARTAKGGPSGGATHLTALGRALAARGPGPLARKAGAPPAGVTRIRGRWHARPYPHLTVGRGWRLWVSFEAEEGEAVAVTLEPESVLLARRRLPTSARNVIPARIDSVGPPDGSTVEIVARTGGTRIRSRITPQALADLRLRPGVPVFLYVKATALRPAP